MDNKGQGRLAVVIGGGDGIGAATARVLVERGWVVAIVDPDMDDAQALAAEPGGRA